LVALNWGIGSNSVNAEVHAFERLYRSWTVRARRLASSLSSTNALLPRLDLVAHRFEIPLYALDVTETHSTNENAFECFAKNRRKHAGHNASTIKSDEVPRLLVFRSLLCL
jgi:hypothetical protein